MIPRTRCLARGLRPRLRRSTIRVGIVSTGLVLAAGCDRPDPAPAPPPATVTTAPPAADGPSGAKRPPEHAFRTLDDEPVTLDALAGDIAIVNFWGTWCLPCRRELPELAELADAYADRGVRVIGIAIDSGTRDEIEAFLADFGVTYPTWISPMETAVAKFGAIGFPFTLIVDREGWIRKEYLGPQTYESLAEEIDALLE